MGCDLSAADLATLDRDSQLKQLEVRVRGGDGGGVGCRLGRSAGETGMNC